MFIRFNQNDVFVNTIRTKPNINFKIVDTNVYYNNKPFDSGTFVSNVGNTPIGSIDLYQNNVDRPLNSFIYPYITKGGSLLTFKTVATGAFNSNFTYGNVITGTYPLTASISSDRFVASSVRPHINAIHNVLDRYQMLSPHFAYSSSFGDKSIQELRLISIPSIFFGSSIDKGSVQINFFVSGTLQAQLVDEIKRGELRQKLPQDGNTGSIAGVVCYNEGLILLTGSWSIHPSFVDHYDTTSPGSTNAPRWIDVGTTGTATARSDSTNCASSSFEFNMNGTQYVNTLTMFCHAKKGELNFSNNPTFINFGQSGTIVPLTGTTQYKEYANVSIKNVVKTNFVDPTGSYVPTTYPNTIGIYDKDKNLIAIAKCAVPMRKRVNEAFSVKLKLDI